MPLPLYSAAAFVAAIAIAIAIAGTLWPRPIALSPEEWRPFSLASKRRLSPDSVLLRFAPPHAGLPVASCLMVRARIGPPDALGVPSFVSRPYTPISDHDSSSIGHLDLVIKVYPSGLLSRHLAALDVGDSVEMQGPIRKIQYETNMKKEIGMIAGGTGITPMLQVAEEALRRPGDTTKFSLILGNVRESDILLRERIDQLADDNPARFAVHYILDEPPPGWRGGRGYVTLAMISDWMPSPRLGASCLVLVCGPPGMMRAVSGDKDPDKGQGALGGLLREAGYTEEQVYKF